MRAGPQWSLSSPNLHTDDLPELGPQDSMFPRFSDLGVLLSVYFWQPHPFLWKVSHLWGWQCLKSESKVRHDSFGGLKLSIVVRGHFEFTSEEKICQRAFVCFTVLQLSPKPSTGRREREVNRAVGAFYVISFNTDLRSEKFQEGFTPSDFKLPTGKRSFWGTLD